MHKMITYAVATLAVLGIAGWTMHTQPQSIQLSAAAMPSLVELHAMAGASNLPNQDIDDQSLIFTAGKR